MEARGKREEGIRERDEEGMRRTGSERDEGG
jgi:hypothetical protein